jgi:RNA 2',3'-cyclic 3'-phosphodiesterase
MRAFIAAEVPGEAQQGMARIQSGLAGRGARLRWVREEGIHVTLRFLGETDDGAIERLRTPLCAAASATPGPLRLHTGPLGSFPVHGPPRIVWISLAGDVERLAEIAARVESAAVSCGWEPERKAFRPHVTLARVDTHRASGLRRLLEDENARTAESGAIGFLVTRIVLFESLLGPGGSRYTPLAGFPLGESAR